MRLSIQFHLRGLSLADTVRVLEMSVSNGLDQPSTTVSKNPSYSRQMANHLITLRLTRRWSSWPMYGRLARDLAIETITPEKLEELERDGVLSYYDTLSSQQRALFHRDLATRYLRYGHIEPAVEQSKQASEYEPYALKTILLRILARGGPTAVTAVRWMMRRYINSKNRIYNRFKCSYNFD